MLGRATVCAALLLAGLLGCASNRGPAIDDRGVWQPPASYQEEQRLRRLLSHAQQGPVRLAEPPAARG